MRVEALLMIMTYVIALLSDTLNFPDWVAQNGEMIGE
jgi:hypothetical protein